MRRTIALTTALGLLAALTLSAAALAGHNRPMTGHFTVAVVPVDQRCGPNALTIGFEGAGIATHLGRMTGSGTNCTEFGLATESVAIWDGIATYIAADGSSITVSYEGVQSAPSGAAASTVTTNTVVSGTGRFAGAEGSWEGTGTIDFTTGLFDGAISGWIGY
jgi:hypothetical protein